ncbi:hypothetical protein [Bacillus sp. HSf4]|uniref:hypothetical protein n=1 Tax=Bacillus sp. HSf4 TaxID=3035514 RepID=UPI0024095A35|nr:hypothetical protein [Bacillus sp. HSf4]WFA05222.1 hypothetical protein P3X63_22125 [Bacillus sp. HSf4]
MRLFEVLLLLSNTGVLLSGFFRKKQRRIAIIIGSGIALLFLVIHWATEGLRVQLLFPYALTVLFFVGSIYGCFKKMLFEISPVTFTCCVLSCLC